MIDPDTLGFALAAGLVAAVNPCGFAMLPAYLALVVTGEDGASGRSRALARALAATGVMACGFLLVFGTFGLVVAPLAASVQRYLPFVTVLIGLALLVLGVFLLAGREITLMLPKPGRGAPTARLGTMFGYGLAYAIASLSCTIGPFLAVTSTTFRGGSVGDGVLAYLAYGAGMALLVGVLAVATALAGSAAATRVRRILPHVNRISGVLLVMVGLYVGYYGLYELRLYLGDGDAADPVIDAAGRVQGVIAGWVDDIGPVPLVIALAALVLGTILATRLRRARAKT
ncbi:1-deoxy-D-xylulose 5-phosphate reductoisomerase [Alloactinosynnema sp. L-07]|uniref:cytochrome c biogenesis CcdA family protein n=1 Tax=Alloactinosynnema sp. L-07 TaxID=1653480 RepID=UPI00065F0933|nr:cytochrome c biogenesis protein CcdA [Alloactinosynnema sp. L-07]CRK57883.1 1-deoxy-D-xylulose 5-phosphate reductoisomerase [Alloactinosynnema sp. L-07]